MYVRDPLDGFGCPGDLRFLAYISHPVYKSAAKASIAQKFRLYLRRFMTDLGPSYRLAFRALADFGATIALPAVVAVLLGKCLDARFGTGHLYYIGCLLLAFVATVFILVKKIRQYAKEYKQLISR